MRFALAAIFSLGLCLIGYGQHSVPDSLVKKRTNRFFIATGIGYTAALIGLNQIWYKDFPRSQFHFFNDNPEWKQLDKAGHFYNSYQLCKATAVLLSHFGQEEKRAHILGSIMGFTMLSSIEILDGFSAEYGASWGDVLANGVGSGLSLGQYLWWQETRIHPKYSFYPSDYARLRPDVLGHHWYEQVIKDYNGQTQWLSFDIYKFLPQENSFPKWLNIAAGYGAEQLIYARDSENSLAGFEGYRQYYLALDLDLSHLQSRNKFTNTLLYLVNMIHLPAPTLEYNKKQGLKFHVISF